MYILRPSFYIVSCLAQYKWPIFRRLRIMYFLSVKIGTRVYTTTLLHQEIQYKYHDFLAALGGTFALFTGSSLMSFIEALFWIFRGIKFAIKKKSKH